MNRQFQSEGAENGRRGVVGQKMQSEKNDPHPYFLLRLNGTDQIIPRFLSEEFKKILS